MVIVSYVNSRRFARVFFYVKVQSCGAILTPSFDTHSTIAKVCLLTFGLFVDVLYSSSFHIGLSLQNKLTFSIIMSIVGCVDNRRCRCEQQLNPSLVDWPIQLVLSAFSRG